ncbi:hypothetical protein H8959_012290 [Pygathrix nigripes]
MYLPNPKPIFSIHFECEDDKPETVIKRLKAHEAQTKPVLEYYQKKRGVGNILRNRNQQDLAL